MRFANVLAIATLLLVALEADPARAELRGKVYLLVNSQAPRSQWQRVPLPQAFVEVDWSVTVPAPAHAVTTCRYSELARSNENGEYVMEGPNFLTASLAHTSYVAYSPGLEPIQFPYGGSPTTPQDITMAPTTRAPAERLSHIALFAEPGCPDTNLRDPGGLLLPYLRNVLDEAKALNVDSERARRDVEHIEAVLKRASGEDKPGPLRVEIAPSSIQGASPALKDRR